MMPSQAMPSPGKPCHAIKRATKPSLKPSHKRRRLGLARTHGAALCVAGLLLEWTADDQKLRCHAARSPRYYAGGGHALWRYCRHPNFCGETCCHAGLALRLALRLFRWIAIATASVSSFTPSAWTRRTPRCARRDQQCARSTRARRSAPALGRRAWAQRSGAALGRGPRATRSLLAPGLRPKKASRRARFMM